MARRPLFRTHGTLGVLRRTRATIIILFLCRWRRDWKNSIPLAPQREAALFYGLFLRGHSAETLRRDIDVPVKLLNKLMFRHRNEQAVRQKLQRTYLYRKQVLSIFDELVTREQAQDRASVRVH